MEGDDVARRPAITTAHPNSNLTHGPHGIEELGKTYPRQLVKFNKMANDKQGVRDCKKH